MKLDILVLAVHPDDAELGCGGTIAKHIAMGYKVGIVDFTRGELGTRGSAEIRDEEAAASAKVLGLSSRENLRFRDGFFRNDEEHQMELIKMIRKYKPETVFANAIEDRHPDHGRASALATDACFYSGLRMIATELDGEQQEAWRPQQVYHYIQDRYIEPDFVVDISDYWDKKDAAIRAFKSQFYDPNSAEPESYIAKPDFLDFVEARSREMGHKIGATFGEGFTSEKKIEKVDLVKG
ncbi:bacillithiol biosynthesis deacetylase BshB1 [Jiulongibacter sp. NS-SX5]|uniref:bacillithiol biosynthesis deacetylase BshB1 n=1 Tax=Jiulongibacter sp. NS-SX5 TaxID=3463854 RepID=UPI004059E739